jgi:hypothetical protein
MHKVFKNRDIARLVNGERLKEPGVMHIIKAQIMRSWILKDLSWRSLRKKRYQVDIRGIKHNCNTNSLDVDECTYGNGCKAPRCVSQTINY